METYQEKVFNTAISLVQDQGMAEDIAQEVFITVFRSVLSFNERSSLSTWIYRITVNKSLDQLRARTRQKRLGVFGSFFQNESGPEMTSKTSFDHPGIRLEQRENARYLFQAIDSLPENQKTAFVLAHIEELPQKDIAEIMNMSVKGVESLLQRAKGNLRKYLNGIYAKEK